MEEIWRVMKPGGRLDLLVQSTEGLGAFSDPMAVTFWNEMTFLSFLEGYATDEGYPKFEVETRGGVVQSSQRDGLGQVWVAATLFKPGTMTDGNGPDKSGKPESGSAEGTGHQPVPDTAGESGKPEVREQS